MSEFDEMGSVQMKNDWTKWILTTTILGMSVAPAAAAASNGNAVNQTAAPITFTDFSNISPGKIKAVQEAVNMGLLNGFPDGGFHPKAALSRQELAVLLTKALRLMPVKPDADRFSDMNSKWAVPYIEAVRQAGLMFGDSARTFRPNDAITHEELAAVIVRAIGGSGAKPETGKGSSNGQSTVAGNWSSDAIATFARLGMAIGDGKGIDPKANVAREDIAALLVEVFKTEELTAKIEKIDGDFVTVGGRTMLIDERFKALFAGKNKEALVGAVLKLTSANRNVSGLFELEIANGGSESNPVVLDLGSLAFTGVLRISGDYVSVSGGNPITRVEIRESVGHIELNGTIRQVHAGTNGALNMSGNARIGTLNVESDTAKISLDNLIRIDILQIPAAARMWNIIANYGPTMGRIGNAEPEPAPAPVYVSPPRVNAPPVASATPIVVTDRTVGDIAIVDVDGTFTDDAAGLTFSAISSDPAIATADVNGTTLTLTPVAPGTTTITLSVTDAGGLTAQRTFTLNVNSAAAALQPDAIFPVDGTAAGSGIYIESAASSYQYNKRNIKHLLKVTRGADTFTDFRYEPVSNSFDVMDGGGEQAANITIEASDPAVITVGKTNNIMYLTLNQALAETDSVSLLIRVKPTVGNTIELALPVTVDNTAPTCVNAAVENDNSAITFTFSEKVFKKVVFPPVNLADVKFSETGSPDSAIPLAENTDYTLEVDPAFKITLTAAGAQKLNIFGGSKFYISLPGIVDAANHPIAAPIEVPINPVAPG